jgi:hypothetical protein
MAELKTKPTGKSVSEFLNGVDQRRQKDWKSIIALMQRATKGKPRTWGERAS